MNILEEIKEFFSETIRKRHNIHRLSDLQLPREAETPYQVRRVPGPVGMGAVPGFFSSVLCKVRWTSP